MEKLQQYRQIIREVLTEEAHPYCHSNKLLQQTISKTGETPIPQELLERSNDVETAMICNTEHDRYQLTYIGWEDQKRIFNVILHLDIKDGKIWVQYNGTETAIAKVLTEKGVPASDIVLGFHSPFKRQFSGYALV